ncbi:hypothetical protein BC938DRAFT_477439 [Jimgerdemannia flammicorona]|uniref:SigF-like NTF2-like domain-containing protein n=1 Tax=Jimgerdemannia flammicorona TaxID=994334 RepID=A0A433P9T4_9FUNG|nr:hypothetical protein BC938DRAFT_477439 [Jimgerdemannia flammicorona]
MSWLCTAASKRHFRANSEYHNPFVEVRRGENSRDDVLALYQWWKASHWQVHATTHNVLFNTTAQRAVTLTEQHIRSFLLSFVEMRIRVTTIWNMARNETGEYQIQTMSPLKTCFATSFLGNACSSSLGKRLQGSL